jgi:PPP family 3-phenylpropionic acid transporter
MALYLSGPGRLPTALVGAVMSLPPLVGIAASPALGAFAERTGQASRVLVSATVLGALLRCALLTETVRRGGAPAIGAVVVAAELLSAGAPALWDAMAMRQLGGAAAATSFGHLRLFGALGWGVAAAAAGAALPGASSGDDGRGWALLFAAHATLAVATGVLVARLPLVPLAAPDSAPAAAETAAVSARGAVRACVCRRAPVALGATAATFGAAVGLMGAFLFVRVAALGGDARVAGASLAVACVAEVAAFAAAPRALARVGPRALLALAAVAYSLRLALQAALRQAWWVVAVEALHGATFGLGWSAAVALAQALAPPGLAATAQGLLVAAQMGVGASVGAAAGGVAVAAWGFERTFRAAALLVLAPLLWLPWLRLDGARLDGARAGTATPKPERPPGAPVALVAAALARAKA